MKFTPWLLGAAILAPVTGAIAGSQMSTEPIGVYADVTASLPDQPIAYNRAGPTLQQERLPDHYPLETPEGRIEVAELAWHGRYRDRVRLVEQAGDYYAPAGYARIDAAWDEAPAYGSSSRAAAALDAQQPSPPRLRMVNFERTSPPDVIEVVPDTAEPAPPPAQIAVMQRLPQNPGARIVDVSAELAQRNH